MKLGAFLYKVSRRRAALAMSLVAAVTACVVTLYRPTLLPPGLHDRHLTIGSATTELLVAKPNLAVGASAYDYESLTNRAILVGNVMVSRPLLTYVGHAIGVSPDRIQGSAPLTANVPRTLIEPGSGGNAANLVASPNQYRLEIQADPSVPILHVYTQAPAVSVATRMATASVEGIHSYLQATQLRGRIARKQRVIVQQLGTVRAGTANPGAPVQIAGLVFFAVFGVSLWIIAIAGRIRSGWLLAGRAARLQS